MKSIIIKRILIITVALFLVGSLCSCSGKLDHKDDLSPIDSIPDDSTESSHETLFLFKSKTNEYRCYRTPTIIKSNHGTLLAFAEGRKNTCSDAGNIDVVMKRSENNGKTWSDMKVIWDDGNNTCGNTVPIVDNKSGKLILVMNWNWGTDDWGSILNGKSHDTRRVYVMFSIDDGKTWSEPKEITKYTKPSSATWQGVGPCHGIQLKHGEHKGRIIIPSYYREKGTKNAYSYVIYSDDAGKTWNIGGVVNKLGPGESTVAELPDGRVYINMRTQSGIRFIAVSNDGGETWKNVNNYDLFGPSCQGSVLSYEGKQENYLFFSNPLNSTERKNMTIQMSLDNGESWTSSYTVHSGPAGYSDLVMISDSRIGIFYEWGDGKGGPHERIAFENIAVDKFK